MTPYDEGEVLAFSADAAMVYQVAGVGLDIGSAVWIARMQYDAVSIGYPTARAQHLAALKQALGVTQGDHPQPKPTGPINGDWQDWFRGLVADKAFGQATLLALEPALNLAGVQLTPPNALGDRTKIGIPQGDGAFLWVRVGFGEGKWVWVVQV